MNAFLENQEDLTACLQAPGNPHIARRKARAVRNRSRGWKRIDGKFPHAPDQRLHVPGASERMDHTISPIESTSRGRRGDALQRLSRPPPVGVDAGHLAQYRDLGQARADIVVQVGRNGGPYAFQIYRLCDALAVRRKHACNRQHDDQAFKPPAPPCGR